MNISDKGLAALRYDEGIKLTAYKDTAGIWTIGVGHTGKVDGITIREGMRISDGKAMELLREDVAIAENVINYYLRGKLTQNQFDALVNLVFNIGARNFEKSTVLRECLKGNFAKAGEAIGYWNKITNPRTGKLELSEGLANRRKRTRAMFERGEYVTS
ncbi:lysozyme [Gallibacterium salpingitidis]|uniref:lysozyme n=1 Tax=Gallibacterium salpingitidis TaxID=505341 RepID=UPI00266FD5AF|nr:lysozyme [Gallibacterium salpingitidis]WKT00516.1 lysozyme [Gallibacterium salpingitidis]